MIRQFDRAAVRHRINGILQRLVRLAADLRRICGAFCNVLFGIFRLLQ